MRNFRWASRRRPGTQSSTHSTAARPEGPWAPTAALSNLLAENPTFAARGLVRDQGRRLRRHKDARARNALKSGRARDGGRLLHAQRDCAPILVTSAAPTVTVIVPHDGEKKYPTTFSSGTKAPAAGPGRRTGALCRSLPRETCYGTVVVPGRRKRALPGRSGGPIWRKILDAPCAEGP